MDSHQPRKLRKTFRKSKAITPLHTSGPFAITSDGHRLLTCVNDEVVLTDVETATEICRFKGDTTSITALAVTPSGTHLAVFYTSLFLRIYELPAERATLDPFPSSSHVPWVRQVSRAHDGPVHVMSIDPTSSYLASGSADGHVKIWDIQRGYVTHHYSGHGGVISALAFHFEKAAPIKTVKSSEPTAKWKIMRLITGSVDSHIRVFDLLTSRTDPIAILEGHVSVPRSLSVSDDGRRLVSSGRDSVILVWDLENPQSDGKVGKKQKLTFKLLATIPVLERVEAAGIVCMKSEDEGGFKVFTAGEKGVVRIWDVRKGKLVKSLGSHDSELTNSESMEEQRQIINAAYLPRTSTVAAMHGDQNILLHSVEDGSLVRQFIGYNDEIIDAVFLSSSPKTTPDSHIAFATNSSLIRVYNADSLDARLLASHSDMVLCLDKAAGGQILGSGSKDRSARIWAPTSDSSGDWKCVAICEGHTESVGGIAFARKEAEGGTLRFMVTGSQDRTIKLWNVQSVPLLAAANDPPIKLQSLSTQVAHEKDINSLDVSPNDQFLATASQDRTAKIFSIEYALKAGGARGDLKLVATLKGHKRGVWNVRFSRFDRIVATGSGDKTVKLWSLEDFSCVKTFEGHTNSVLRVDFLNRGMQLVTAAADGLVKVWNIKDEECTTTLDNHEAKVWAIAIPTNEKYMVSAAADSVVTFWEDCTELEEEELQAAKVEIVLKEQDFINYVSLQDYRNAILLALSMDQPGRLYNLFQAIRPHRSSTTMAPNSPPSITGNASVDQVIKTLPPIELTRLLKHVRNWNASPRTYSVAQTVLNAILKLRSASDILKAFNGQPNVLSELNANMSTEDEAVPGRDKDMRALKDLLDGLIPYTERHFNRAEKLVQDSFVVDYILSEMDSGILVDSIDQMEEEI